MSLVRNNKIKVDYSTKKDVSVTALVSVKDHKVKILSIEEVNSNENDKPTTNEG